VLAAASTVQIASESIVVLAPAQIRAEIAAQLAKLPPPPVGPASQQLNEAVQSYLTANAAPALPARDDAATPAKRQSALAGTRGLIRAANRLVAAHEYSDARRRLASGSVGKVEDLTFPCSPGLHRRSVSNAVLDSGAGPTCARRTGGPL
jgi:hypothetical protein